ncbi:hypothetical protein KAI56_03985 [Candidatus Parcubacteria bacterium]|nr:hypothetical protein [Candidatus Parcubacteria bacterium]
MVSEKINKKSILSAIILFASFAMLFCLICFFYKVPEVETEIPVVKEKELSIIERLTVPVDPNVEVEPLSEEVIKRLTVPVDPNVEVEPLSEEVIKSLTVPK